MSNLKALMNYKVILPILMTLSFFTYWAISTYFYKAFVWDEIVSLTNFVLVDLNTTITHYPDVNNHVFFNVVNNLFCSILSVTDLYDAMDKVASIRILPFIISLSTIIYTWAIGRKFFNNSVANMAVIILVTTLPFLNFTMQLRGYTFSASLLMAALYHLLSFERSARSSDLVLSLLFVTSLLYTIPSNVFFALSIGFLFFIRWLDNGKNLKKGNFNMKWIQNRYFVILACLALSAFLSYLFYLPILDDILNERHLQAVKGKAFYAYNVTDLFPKVLFYLTSFKVLFLIPIILGPIYIRRSLKNKNWKDEPLYHALFILFLFLLPFVISFVRGDKTPQRSFIPLSGPFAILCAISIHALLRDVKIIKRYPLGFFTLIFVYCIASFFYSDAHRNKVLHKAILDGDKMNTMMYNFYQSDEYGMPMLDPLIEEVKRTGYPILMAKEIDRVSEGEYLQKNDLKYFSTVWSRQTPAKNEVGYQYAVLLEISQGKGKKPGYNRIGFPPTMPKESGKLVPLFYYLMQNNIIDKKDPKCYVLTFSPRWFEGVMQSSLPNIKYERMSPKISYHNVYLLSIK